MQHHTKTALLSLASWLPIRAETQAFEPADFNVTEALLQQGVDIVKLAVFEDIEQRSTYYGKPAKSCLNACSSLKQLFGDENVETKGETAYRSFLDAFWSRNQAEVQPSCIFKPSYARDVSVVVLLSRLTGCPFAVKSGGHAAFAGASNIQDGVTISLEKLNEIKLSKDNKIASIGPGNTWFNVYSTLAKSDLAVIGGRVSRIGVGGLTTGGGISFLSNEYGWACDNVESYEVVTASGIIATASVSSHPDLYFALRGGGNNYGIITRFNLRTVPFPQGNLMWGGSRIHTEESFDGIVSAFAKFIADSPSDPKAGQWVAFAQNDGTKLAVAEMWYTAPDSLSAQTFFKDYFNLPKEPLQDTTRILTMPDYTVQVQKSNPYGLRESWGEITVKADPAFIARARDILYESLTPEILEIPGLNPVMVFQGITKGQLEPMSRDGGNPLGLSAKSGPYCMISISPWWQDAKDDGTVNKWILTVLQRVAQEAKVMGVAQDYIYMNYANQAQDVIASYGAENKARLQRIAKNVDPQGVFQTLQPGYFKLNGPHVANRG